MRLPKAYNPAEYESDIYALWEQKGSFQPKSTGEGGNYYALSLPPPNANGDLHMGHALTVAIEDALARYHRMKGDATLYLPGADHAGFETWVVYEKQLNQKGKSRFDFSREELYKQVWDFVETNKQNFQAQLRALGASLDWTRFTYSLDKKVVETAYQTFQKMWDDELVYRGKRLVNFCTFHGTSFSDIEVVHEEEDTKLWYIGYPLTEGAGEIVIATTRPETIFADTAVAVHPNDKRYQDYVGKTVSLPLAGRAVPVVADQMVDPDFGTGAVKITPGHDPNDFEVAERHNLPAIELITTEGKLNEQAPKQFRGLPVMSARQAVSEALNAGKYVRKVEPFSHSVGKCYKCGTVIEPLLREQWFVSMRPLADRALDELKKDRIKFYPASKKPQLEHYLTEVRDWNISRQIPWGIPIPAFQNIADPKDWIYDARVDKKSIEVDNWTYKRDPDVFDTWFSSGQWPYVTLNYPDGEEFKQFYPLSLMETGGEILYQWVARMIMLSLYVTNDVPFTTVYIHGYVLAEDGAKMSKSLGNVINPMEAVAEFGSDALRGGMLTGRRPGVNQGYHPSKIKAARNFANKLWNIARFIEAKAGDAANNLAAPTPTSPADHWICQRANATSQEITAAMENYRLSEAYERLYDFIWHDLADWYVEASKVSENAPLLVMILETSLKLAHPFAPFVTETIWQTLAWRDSLLISESWPQTLFTDSAKAQQFQDIVDIVSQTRQIATSLKVQKPNLYFRDSPLVAENAELIKQLGRLGKVEAAAQPKGQGIRLPKVGVDCWLDIEISKTTAYIDTLIERKSQLQASIDRLESRLSNADYTQKAPPEIVAESQRQLEIERALATQNEQEINTFSQLVAPVSQKPKPDGPAPGSPPA